MTIPIQPFSPSIVMGPPGFITISNIYVIPGTDSFTLTCDTDQVCWLALDWERTVPPADPGQLPVRGTISGAGPQRHHTFISPTSFRGGQEVQFVIRKDDNDNTLLFLRPEPVGRNYVIILGERHERGLDVPVRFYNFGDTPPPVPGGDDGDWNTYIWAQYNPNGQPFVRTNWPHLDIFGTDGTRIIPVLRCFARVPNPVVMQIELDAPVPNQWLLPQNQMAEFKVYRDGQLKETFCFSVDPQAHGMTNASEALVRAAWESRLVRFGPLQSNNKDSGEYFMDDNYYLSPLPQTALVWP